MGLNSTYNKMSLLFLVLVALEKMSKFKQIESYTALRNYNTSLERKDEEGNNNFSQDL